jgi:hypothetical protein
MDGTSAAADDSFSRIFKGGHYYRLQADLGGDLLKMDEPRNVIYLIKEANKFCDHSGSPFNKFIERYQAERKFMANLRTEYGHLNNNEFILLMDSFQKLVGFTHEETHKNIGRLLSGVGTGAPDSVFAAKIAYCFNDVRLLKALAIEIDKISNSLDL